MLRWRTVTALVLAPIVLGAILVGQFAVYALILVVVGIAAYELSRALKPLPFLAALGAGTIPVLLAIPFDVTGIMAGVCFSLPWALFWLTGIPQTRTLRALLAILLMATWVGASLAHLGLISGSSDRIVLALVVVAGPWISDSGAYFAGRLAGRHPLFPTLSPNKTIEGAIGGMILTMLVVGWMAHQFLGFSITGAAIAGLAISFFSQTGDLFESILKRILDIKDLGSLLPGHGGILDRIDSLLFTAPAVYYVLLLV